MTDRNPVEIFTSKSGLSNNLKGLSWLLGNEVFTLFHLVLIKILGLNFPVIEIVFIRCLTSSVILFPLLYMHRNDSSVMKDKKLNALRVLFSAAALTSNFFVISKIQLSQVSLIGYLRPAAMSLIAIMFLKERPSIFRWLIILTGFSGIWIMLAPDNEGDGFIMLIALGCVFFGSFSVILQKKLSQTMDNLSLMIWYSFGITLITGPFAVTLWKVPSMREACMLIATGILSTNAQYFFINAYRYAEASFLAPMHYFHIIPVTIIGFVTFAEVPSFNTVLGAGILLCAFAILGYIEIKQNNYVSEKEHAKEP